MHIVGRDNGKEKGFELYKFVDGPRPAKVPPEASPPYGTVQQGKAFASYTSVEPGLVKWSTKFTKS